MNQDTIRMLGGREGMKINLLARFLVRGDEWQKH